MQCPDRDAAKRQRSFVSVQAELPDILNILMKMGKMFLKYKGKTKSEFFDECYQMRLKIIELAEKGMAGKEIAEKLGVSDGYVSRIKLSYNANGIEALKIVSSQNSRSGKM